MTKQELFEYFSDLPIRVHDKCLEEICASISTANPPRLFVRKLMELSHFLAAAGVDALQAKNIEKLTGIPGVCSVRIKVANKNTRVLFSFCQGGELYLLAFDEDWNKRSSSYEKHRETALARKQEMEREFWRGEV